MTLKELVSNVLFVVYKHTGSWGRKKGIELKYHFVRHRWPNLAQPKDLSEHILSMMCKPEFLKYSDLADKVKVHDYIKSKGLENILLKQYKIWDSVDEIDISELPSKFILKPNNGSGGHVYCRDKSKFDLDKAKKYIQENLQRAEDYYFEPHYLLIEPKIFAEELLDLGEGKVLTDYKFTCIKGEIVDIFLAGENENGESKYATLDLNWNILPYTKPEYAFTNIPTKPAHLSEMIEYAKILSKDFPFVRVDFYEHEDNVYFSELTFSPWGGYMYSYTDEAIQLLGSKF